MKIIIYYLLLLVLIGLMTGFVVFNSGSSMSMQTMLGVSGFLVLYTVALSLAGEGANQDERDVLHKNLSNRAGLISGTIIFSLGILYQLFTHHLDYWLLIGLIVINLTKITSLIYLNYKK